MNNPKFDTVDEATTNGSQNVGAVFAFESICDPGAYICNWSGHLLRVPPDAVAPGRSPVLNIVGNGPMSVTTISCTPYFPITKAKLIAANFDLCVDF